LSKVLAEKAAWDFAKEHDLDLVVVNPSGVFGPVLYNYVTSSDELLLNVLNGAFS
jgi:nucleoside-diphosphate-sugar epimerase